MTEKAEKREGGGWSWEEVLKEESGERELNGEWEEWVKETSSGKKRVEGQTGRKKGGGGRGRVLSSGFTTFAVLRKISESVGCFLSSFCYSIPQVSGEATQQFAMRFSNKRVVSEIATYITDQESPCRNTSMSLDAIVNESS